jgi:methylmalonyl-CoA mutase cobalamin-binding subunit
MRAIRSRIAALEARIGHLDGGTPMADFIRRSLRSSGLDPDRLPPLTEEEQAWAERVFEAAAQADADQRRAGAD